MYTLKNTWTILVLLLVFASCKRDSLNPGIEENATKPDAVNIEAANLVVPTGFNFDAEKTLNVRVKVADAKPGERYVIKIYSDVPATGKLIMSGLTNTAAEYSTTVRLPGWEEFIYIEKISPDGSSSFEKVNANRFVNAVMGSAPQSPYIIRKAGSGMNCSACSRTVNNPSGGNLYVLDETLCLTGTISNVTVTLITGAHLNIIGNVTGGVTIIVGDGSYSTVRVCGTGTIDHIQYDADGSVYFLEGSVMKVKNITTATGCRFVNWSDSLEITENYVPYVYSYTENNGKMYFSKSAYLNTQLSFVNNGSLFFYGSQSDLVMTPLNLSTAPTFTNNHYMYVERNLTMEPECVFNNNCHLYVKNNLDSEGKIFNSSYIKVGNEYQQSRYQDAYLEMQNGALLSAKHFEYWYGTIKGTGSTRSKIKVADVTNIFDWFGAPTIEGSLDFCDMNGVESNQATLVSPAAFSCSGSLPTSTCNPEGFGQSTVTDTDNDGVADAQDEYPNDATRAFNSYYPNAATLGTIGFEDLWPSKADYEFNDLSILFNIQQVLNADNKVVEYKVKLKVKAVGGSYVNGFGFQLDDLVPSDVSAVTGQTLVHNLITRNANNTEAGQSKAVIICYDTPEPSLQRAPGSMFNTIKTNGVGTSDTLRINITFSNPIDNSKLTLDKFNPFIFTNKRRGYEVHLGNFRPTSLANTALFGTFEDRTNPSNNVYYKNANGMPWAILIPEEFAHAKEKAPITSAYNFFDDWAVSGGTTYTHWYSNTPGNQNTDNIY